MVSGTSADQIANYDGGLTPGLGNAVNYSDTTQPNALYNSRYFRLTDVTIETIAPGVPEPSTWLMVLAGFVLTGAALRRRRVVFAA